MKYLLAIIIAVSAVSCANPKTSQTPPPQTAVRETTAKIPQEEEEHRLLVSKGIIRSIREVKVYSTVEGQLKDVKLIEGQKVKTGEVLFTLDDMDFRGKVALKESEYQQAMLKMEEILVGLGFKRNSLDEVPEKTREYAKIKSGVGVKSIELEQARNILKRTVITAELSGVVTGIDALSYDFVKPGKTLCTIVDPTELIVEFSILETELRKFRVGTEIEVRSIAYADIPHRATVRSIGSVVDSEGMVKVEAVISDSIDLIPGMTAIINL